MLHTVNFASNNFSTKTVSFFKVKVIRPLCILKQDKTKWSWHIVETNYTVDRDWENILNYKRSTFSINFSPFSAAAFCLCRILFSSAVASSFGLSSRMSPAEWLRGFLNTTFFSSLLPFPASPELDVSLEDSTLELGLRSLIFAHSTGEPSAPGELTPGPTSTLGFLFNVFWKSRTRSVVKHSL